MSSEDAALMQLRADVQAFVREQRASDKPSEVWKHTDYQVRTGFFRDKVIEQEVVLAQGWKLHGIYFGSGPNDPIPVPRHYLRRNRAIGDAETDYLADVSGRLLVVSKVFLVIVGGFEAKPNDGMVWTYSQSPYTNEPAWIRLTWLSWEATVEDVQLTSYYFGVHEYDEPLPFGEGLRKAMAAAR
jgi:hypothetical protein